MSPSLQTMITAARFIEIPPEIAEKQPDQRTPEEQAAVELIARINGALVDAAAKSLQFDDQASKYRFGSLMALGLVTGLATVGMLLGILVGSGTARITAIITGGAVTITSLIIGGLINPIQSIERDIIYRRWSDTIASAFWLRLSQPQSSQSHIGRAATAASTQFAALATAYTGNAGQVLNALQSIAKAAGEGGDDEEDEEIPPLSITNPGEQKSSKGQPLEEGLQIEGTGAEPLVYSARSLPSGLKIDSKTGKIQGTPSVARDFQSTVTLTQQDSGSTVDAKFKWSVVEADGGTPAEEAPKPR